MKIVDQTLHEQFNCGLDASLDAYDVLKISYNKLERKLNRVNALVLELDKEIEKIVTYFINHGEVIKSPGYDQLFIIKNELKKEAE